MRRTVVTLAAIACGTAAVQLLDVTALHADSALVLSTDYTTAYYSRLDLAPPYAHTINIGPVCADAGARADDGTLYVLGRFGCNHVQVIDGTSFATLDQWSTGSGTNPQDIEIISPTKAYISLYERDYILIVNPQTGDATGSVSLAEFADADGLPEAASMARVGDRVFVALQRLDRPGGYVASNPSYLAVIDCTTDQLVDVDPVAPGIQAIVLSGRNPFSDLVLDPVRQKLYVAEAGDFGVLDGGVEFIDPVSLHAEGMFVTEATLGGDLNAVRLWTDCTGYAIVNDASYRTKLVRFDRCAGTLLGTPWQSTGFDLCDVEIDFARAHVLVSDRDLVTPGVRLFAATTGSQLTTNPIDFGLPPCELVLVSGSPPADVPGPVPPGPTLVPNWPDPFNPSTSLRIEAGANEDVRLDVFDVAGRLVRTLWNGPVPPGGRTVQWDGRDGTGVALPSGVYMARLIAGNVIRMDRMTLVR